MKKILSIILSVAMIFGTMPVLSFATEEGGSSEYSYVSIGASNTNGYGLRGYVDDALYSTPWNMDTNDVSGYGKAPEGSYPSLILEELKKTHSNATLTQLSMSGMRAEEVRMLLDEDYTGDSYTAWRFYGEDSQKWFEKAGGLDKLRDDYKNAITGADFISIDIGANNFGVYMANRVFNNMYDSDLESILTDEEMELYQTLKSDIKSYIEENVTLTKALKKQMDKIADAYAYALFGFCKNYDVIIEKIKELNSDAEIVVVSIQNVVDGITLEVDGVDDDFPIGDLNGYIINIANAYMAAISDYSDDVYFADVREKGCVTSFVDDFKNYDGNPENISQNCKDAFDAYQEGLYCKTRIQHLVLKNLLGQSSLTLEQYMQAGGETASIDLGQSLSLSFNQFTYLGELGELGSYTQYYNIYKTALNSAYDSLMTMMKEFVSSDSVSLNAYLKADTGKIEKYLLLGINQIMQKAAIASVNTGGAYDSELTMANGKMFKLEDAIDGLINGDLAAFLTLTEIQGLATDESTSAIFNELFETDGQSVTCKVDAKTIETVANMGARISISNSLASHPNEQGHIELKDAILDALENKTSGETIVNDEIANLVKQGIETYSEVIEEDFNKLISGNLSEADIEKYEEEIQIAVAKLQQIAGYIDSIPQVNKTRRLLEAVLDAASESLGDILDEACEDLEDQIDKQLTELENGEITALNEKISEVKKTVDSLVKLSEVLGVKAAATAGLEAFAAELEDLTGIVLDVENITKDFDEIEKFLEEAEKEGKSLSQITKYLDSVSDDLTNLAKIKEEIENLPEGRIKEALTDAASEIEKNVEELKNVVEEEIIAQVNEISNDISEVATVEDIAEISGKYKVLETAIDLIKQVAEACGLESSEIEILDTMLSSIESSINEKTADMDKTTQELKEEIEKKAKEIEKLKEELSEAEQSLEETKKKIAELENEKAEKEKELEEAEALEKEILELKKENASLILKDFTAKAVSSAYNKITVSWTKVEGADGYLLDGEEISASKVKKIFKAEPGITQKHKVTAYKYVNDEKTEKVTKTVTVSAKTTIGKAKITKTKAYKKKVNKYKKKRILVKWNKVTGAQKYQVYVSTNSKFTKNVKKYNNVKGTSTTLKNLKKAKSYNTYYVKVRAKYVNSNGKTVYGKWSTVKKVTFK